MYKGLAFLIALALATGEFCMAPVTIWDRHVCEKQSSGKIQPQCIPRRLFPYGATGIAGLQKEVKDNRAGKVRGLVVYFHGFTACPDAFDYNAQKLQYEGFMVLSPLLPGMGIIIGYNCDKKGECVADGSNPSEIPTNKEEYIDWTYMVHNMIREQVDLIPESMRAPDFQVHTVGLSLGAPLAVLTAEHDKSLIQDIIVINPLWSSTAPALDFNVKRCMDTKVYQPKDCILRLMGESIPFIKPPEDDGDNTGYGPFKRLIFAVIRLEKGLKSWILENSLGNALTVSYRQTLLTLWQKMAEIGDSPLLMKLGILNGEYGWGTKCMEQVKLGRGGICTFRLKHLIALQSLTSYIIGNLDHVPSSAGYREIRSDIDGGIRDAISIPLVRALNGKRCSFETTCSALHIAEIGVTKDNVCGAPHSLYSRIENSMNAPYSLYWEADLFTTVSKQIMNPKGPFANDRDPLGVDPSICVRKNESLNWGETFENLGVQYIIQSQDRYQGHFQQGKIPKMQ